MEYENPEEHAVGFHTVSRLSFEYYQMLIPYFDKCIQITNDASPLVEVTCCKKKDNIIIRRLQQSDLEIIHQK